ncbi:MAG: zinc ribbon domain-containing protein [Bacillota bacterium]
MKKLDALWRYQLADLEYDKLENQLKNSKARQNLLRIRKFLIDQQDRLLKMEGDAEKKLARLKEMMEQFDHQNSLFTEMEAGYEDAPKDDLESVNAMLNEYTKVQSEIVLIRRELYALMQDLKGAETKLQDMRSKISKARRDFAKFKEEHNKELEASADELGRLQSAVKAVEKEVDPALLERYKEIKKNKSAPLALIEADQCGGCNMTLPSLMVSQVQEGSQIFECENCGRILYYPS